MFGLCFTNIELTLYMQSLCLSSTSHDRRSTRGPRAERTPSRAGDCRVHSRGSWCLCPHATGVRLKRQTWNTFWGSHRYVTSLLEIWRNSRTFYVLLLSHILQKVQIVCFTTTYIFPKTKLIGGERAFSLSILRGWNQLPITVVI